MTSTIEINKSTLLPLGLVIFLLGAVISGVAWATRVQATQEANTAAISEVKQDNKDFQQKVLNRLDNLQSGQEKANENIVRLQTQAQTLIKGLDK